MFPKIFYRSIALLCKFTKHGVDDDPGTAEAEDADRDQNIQQSLSEGGKIRSVGDINVPSTKRMSQAWKMKERI